MTQGRDMQNKKFFSDLSIKKIAENSLLQLIHYLNLFTLPLRLDEEFFFRQNNVWKFK